MQSTTPANANAFDDEVEANGFFPALVARLFGRNTARLSERLQPAHWLSYVLILAQSATVLLVFGHAEVALVLSNDVAIRIIAALGVFILVTTVVASDMAMLRTIQRIPALARNRQRWALREHVAYTLFVLLTEACTLGVVLSVLDSSPTDLVSPKPLIPPDSFVFQLAIILRVLLVAWTSVQLIIVRGKLPVLLSTLNATAREIVGAHVERKLATMRTEHVNLRAGYRTYANMSKPPRRVRTWWNGWLVARELAKENEEERQVSNVLSALEEMERYLPQDSAQAPAPQPESDAGNIPPEPPEPPRGRPDDAPDQDDGKHAAETSHYVPQIRILPDRRAVNQAKARKLSEGEARRIKGFALLDANPEMSKRELARHLHTRADTASAIYSQWQRSEQKGIAR